jgi:hypothetical protein
VKSCDSEREKEKQQGKFLIFLIFIFGGKYLLCESKIWTFATCPLKTWGPRSESGCSKMQFSHTHSKNVVI